MLPHVGQLEIRLRHGLALWIQDNEKMHAINQCLLTLIGYASELRVFHFFGELTSS